MRNIYFQYLFCLLLLLVGECVVSVLVVLCPQYLGLTLNREILQDNWQRTYGVPGREQYTAAIDLIQTKVSANELCKWRSLKEMEFM